MSELKMALADVMDRWSIALLKKHAGGLDVDAEIARLAQAAMNTSIAPDRIYSWLCDLVLCNSLIWSLEADIRLGKEGRLGFEEVGRRAIAIRDHNRKRTEIKARISIATGDTPDVKVDHASA